MVSAGASERSEAGGVVPDLKVYVLTAALDMGTISVGIRQASSSRFSAVRRGRNNELTTDSMRSWRPPRVGDVNPVLIGGRPNMFYVSAGGMYVPPPGRVTMPDTSRPSNTGHLHSVTIFQAAPHDIHPLK